jgi:hypothetical protein
LETLTCGRSPPEQGSGRAAGMRDRRFRSGITLLRTCLRGEPRGYDNYGCVARGEDVECRDKCVTAGVTAVASHDRGVTCCEQGPLCGGPLRGGPLRGQPLRGGLAWRRAGFA